MSKIETRNKSGKTVCITGHDAANNWIYADWKGFVTPEDIKSWSTDFLKLLNQTRCANFLNNHKDLSGPWQQANDWIAAELTPKAIAGGLRNYAHIVSPNIFAELSANDLEKKISGVGFTMRMFRDTTEAHNWLRSQ